MMDTTTAYQDIVGQINEAVDNFYRPHRDKALICSKSDFETGKIPVMLIHQFRNGKPYNFFAEIWPSELCEQGKAFAVKRTIEPPKPKIDYVAQHNRLFVSGMVEEYKKQLFSNWTNPTIG